MVLRQEVFDRGAVDDEKDGAAGFSTGECGKLLQVPPPTLRDGIGKHGHLFTEEGARLYLEVYLPTPLPEEKVKSAPPHSDLPLDNRRPFKTGYEPPLDEVASHIVVGVGVEHYWITVPLDSHRGEGELAPFAEDLFEIDGDPRQEKLPQPPRIRQKCPYHFAVQITDDHKTVGPRKKTGLPGIVKEFHPERILQFYKVFECISK